MQIDEIISKYSMDNNVSPETAVKNISQQIQEWCKSKQIEEPKPIPDTVIDSIKSILDYCWEDEANDAATFFKTYDKEDYQKHIFYDLVTVDQFIYKHNASPEQMLKDSGLLS